MVVVVLTEYKKNYDMSIWASIRRKSLGQELSEDAALFRTDRLLLRQG